MAEMNSVYSFRMNPGDPGLKQSHPGFVGELTAFVNGSAVVDSKERYLSLIGGITDIIAKYANELTMPTPLYDKELERIGKNELTFKTPWGGVAFKEVSVTNNHVEKLLVVEQARKPSGVLGFEYHHKKDEKLEIEEGYAIFISTGQPSETGEETVTLTFAQKGDTAVLHPGIKHGVIALTNLVIRETSTCDLDIEDLLFVF